MSIEAVHILSGQNVINPYVADSVLYFAADVKSEFVKTHLDANGNKLFHLYKMKLRNGKPYGSMTPVLTEDMTTNQVSITRSGCDFLVTKNNTNANADFFVTQNNADATNSDGANLLGIFQADPYLTRSEQVMRQPNNSNIAFPSVSPDGKMMIFVSDMPGGEGSSDLYMCERESMYGHWSNPVNLGTTINTRGSETSPFIHPSGKIFFASNGRSDSRKLDIYYTYRTKNGFATPVRYDSNVNGNADDYGIYLSDDEEWGYIASNRYGRDVLFYFHLGFPSFPEVTEFVEDNFCYTLYEGSTDNYDPSMFTFRWDVSDGFTAYGAEVDHCFAGAGDYIVSLSVLDKTSGEELFSIAEFPLSLHATEQVKIIAPHTVKQGQEVTFEASGEYITTFTPKAFYWDFGKLGKEKGVRVTKKFNKKGSYMVRCGTIAVEDKNTRLCTWIEIKVE